MDKIFYKFLVGFIFLLCFVLGVANKTEAAAVITVTVTATPTTVAYGGTSTIKWTSTNATSCTRNDTGASVALNDNVGFSTGPLYNTTTFSITCTSPAPPPTCLSYYPVCFIADTIVAMADGSKKNIQDVKVGDVLKGETTDNTVLGLHQPQLDGRKLYSFNGGRYFVTAEHPFKTIDGWKSIDPSKTAQENIGITVTELKVGDTLITEKGKVLLKTIDSKDDKAETSLYNFALTGDHTYYADGYLVHNKVACLYDGGGNAVCGGPNFCIDGSAHAQIGGAYCPLACNPLTYTPGTHSCDTGYTSICENSAIICKTCNVTYHCTGIVTGSSPTTYEGQTCTQFGTSADCLQGWLTHGCSWDGTVAVTGVCTSDTGAGVCKTYKAAGSCNANASCYWVDYYAQ